MFYYLFIIRAKPLSTNYGKRNTENTYTKIKINTIYITKEKDKNNYK